MVVTNFLQSIIKQGKQVVLSLMITVPGVKSEDGCSATQLTGLLSNQGVSLIIHHTQHSSGDLHKHFPVWSSTTQHITGLLGSLYASLCHSELSNLHFDVDFDMKWHGVCLLCKINTNNKLPFIASFPE